MLPKSRRDILKAGLGSVVLGGVALSAAPSLAEKATRRLSFHNLHTGESLDAVYRQGGVLAPDALAAVDHVLRDYRTGDVHTIDPRLLDLLATLSARVNARSPFQVISGYRSPATNAMLHAHSDGVAKSSLHMKGLAIDIRLADVDLDRLHGAALGMSAGGVGYYPTSNFVHVDVGAVRRWSGA